MLAQARVTIEVWAEDKDTGRRINLPTKTKFAATDILLGDGNAEAGRDVYMKLSEGDYNAFTLGTTASVRIRCNQDDDTIKSALRTCGKLAQDAVRDYQPTIERVLKQLVEDHA